MTTEDRAILDFAMRKVQFETGSSTLTVDSYTTLDKVAEIMVKYPDYYLIINGHTDNVGRAQANLMLSDQRAKACFNFLVSRGVARGRMLASGFGDTKPITSNRTEEGRALNRRVEFIVYLK
jgi:OmpA-OmpF porin, OOP family